MSGREAVLGRVRSALGRRAREPIPAPPAVRIRTSEHTDEQRIDAFRTALEKLAGTVYIADSQAAALEHVQTILNGRRAVASNSRVLEQVGIPAIPQVSCGVRDTTRLRELCADVPVGITSADFALADTGSLVILASHEEARMISLLPPAHIAVVPRERVLWGLDELLMHHSCPADVTSAMVLITGPSRTADIEQILVRGVHGPGEVHVIIV